MVSVNGLAARPLNILLGGTNRRTAGARVDALLRREMVPSCAVAHRGLNIPSRAF